MFCSSCGKEVRPDAVFCDGCGKNVAPEGSSVPPAGFNSGSSPFPSEADVVCFVGEKSGYYLGKFRKFQVGRVETFAPTWNWASFLGTFWWFLYRKMYLWAGVSFVVGCIPYLGLLAWIGWGIGGNYLYSRHVSAKIAEVSAVTPPDAMPALLAQLGGVNRWVVTVMIVLGVIAVIGIAAAISIPFFMTAVRSGGCAI